jgi:hypothetical protein
LTLDRIFRFAPIFRAVGGCQKTDVRGPMIDDGDIRRYPKAAGRCKKSEDRSPYNLVERAVVCEDQRIDNRTRYPQRTSVLDLLERLAAASVYNSRLQAAPTF